MQLCADFDDFPFFFLSTCRFQKSTRTVRLKKKVQGREERSKPVVDARGCDPVSEFGRRGERGDARNDEATDSDPGEPNEGNVVLICDPKTCVFLHAWWERPGL